MATVYGNMPNNTNLELVLDVDSLCLLGVSEAGTSKTLHFAHNPNVSISWCRQLRPHEEETYNYYCSYGVKFVNQQEGEKKYAYDLLLSESFLDELVAYKNAFISTPEGLAEVEAHYATGMYPMLDGLCAQYGAPTSLQIAMTPTTAAGLKTQTTWVPAAAPAEEGAKTGTAADFHGTITASVTLNEDGTIATLSVDTSCEHQDYGAKVGTGEAFIAQFIGQTGPFVLGVGIDAVTSATGSSASAVEAINNALR